MYEYLALLGVAIAPSIYLAILIYGYDKYDREPKRILLVAFLLGCLSTIPAVLMGLFWIILGFDASDNLIDTAFFAFVVIAFSEEISKFIMLRLHAYRLPEFNEPFDGIVYAVFVALGFATTENILYVMESGLGTGIARMFTAVPAHYAFGCIMGYYVGKAKFKKRGRVFLMIVGIFFAVLLHGAYDFFLLQTNYPALALMMIPVLLLSWVLSKRAIRTMQLDSQFRFRDRDTVD